MAFKISEDGLDFIRQNEGFISNAAPDAKTDKTAIGYGDTLGDQSKPITKEEAERRLRDHVRKIEEQIGPMLKRDLPQHQQDVLGDMAYNAGVEGIREFIDTINSGDEEKAYNDLLKYNKSTDAETNRKYVHPALVTRTQARQNRWSGDSQTQQYRESDSMVANDPLSDLNDFQPTSQNTDDPLSDLNDFKPEENPRANSPAALNAGLDISKNASSNEELILTQEAQNIADKTGMHIEDAKAQLYKSTPAEVYAKHRHSTMSMLYPTIAKWAQEPNNYVLMSQAPDHFMQLELAAKPLNKSVKNDLEKAVSANAVQIERASLHARRHTMNPEEWIREMEALDVRKAENVITTGGYKKIAEAKGFWGTMKSFAKYPGDAAIAGIENLSGTVGPLATGAVAGTAAGPVGGIIGAGMAGVAIGYSAHMDQLIMDKFADPVTGKVDYRKVINDTEFLKQADIESGIYAGVTGAMEALTSGVFSKATKFIPNKLSKFVPAKVKTSVPGKAGKVIGGFVGGATVEGASEAIQEITATSSADLYAGRLTPEKFKKNLEEGAKEGAFGILIGGGAGVAKVGISHVGSGVMSIFNTAKESAAKTSKMAEEANKANEDAQNLDATRKKQEENPATADNQKPTEDLVNGIVEEEQQEMDLDSPIEEDIEGLAESEYKNIDAEAESGVVHIAPSEFYAYHNLNSIDPKQTLSQFSADIQQEFARNLDSDSSVAIPTAVWVTLKGQFKDIDVIARLNGNDLNAAEANEVADALEKDPFMLFAQNPTDGTNTPKGWDVIEPPPMPEGETAPRNKPDIDVNNIEIIEPTEAADNLILRPVELTAKYANDAEKLVASSLYNRLVATAKKSKSEIDVKAIKPLADVLFRRTRNRAAVLNIPIDEMGKRLQLGVIPDSEAVIIDKKTGVVTATIGGWFNSNKTAEGAFTIAFSKYASTNTIIHEFGHMWLQEMAEDYAFINAIADENLTPAQRDYKIAMDSAAALFGMETIEDLTKIENELRNAIATKDKDKEKRFTEARQKIHETFAKTAEKYFLEGKYENSRVKSVMEAFRKFMVDIAELVASSWAQYKELEISPAVERMFEGILGVSNAVEEVIIPMFDEPLYTPQMLGKEGEKYFNDYAMARSEAIGEAVLQAHKQPLKEREKLIEKHQDRLLNDAANEVDQEPAMIMLKDMQNAYIEHKKKNTPSPRFSYESVLKLIAGGDEVMMMQIKDMADKVMIENKKKGGTDISRYMYINGIADIEVMKRLLLETGMREQKIEEKFKQKINEEIPAVKSDEEIHNIAVKAVNNKGRKALLLAEMNILMSKYKASFKALIGKAVQGPEYIDKVTRKEIEEQAVLNVRNASAFKFNANKYLREAGRLRRRAAQMLRANNIQECFNYKLKEALHFFGYQAAVEAQKEMAVVRAIVNQFMKAAQNKVALRSRDADIMAYGYNAVLMIKQGLIPPKFSDENISAMSGVNIEHINNINNARQEFIEQSQGRIGKNMSVGAVVELGKFLSQIYFMSKKAKEVEIDGQKVLYAEAEAQGNQEILAPWNKTYNEVFNKAMSEGYTEDEAENLATKEANKHIISFKPGTVFGIQNRRINLTKVDALFNSLSSSTMEYTLSMLGKLYDGIRQAEAAYRKDYSDKNARLVKAIRKVVGGDSTMVQIFNPMFSRIPGVKSMSSSAKEIISHELGFIFNNKAELFYAMLMVKGSKSGAEKFLLGNVNDKGNKLSIINPETNELDMTKWNEFEARMIAEGVLDKRHYDMFQEIWDIMEEVHPGVKEAMRRSDGFNMGHIDGVPFTNEFGSYRGGYVMIKALSDSIDDSLNNILSVDTNTYHATEFYPHQDTSMTDQRTKVYRPTDLDMSKLSSYLSATMAITHLRNPLMDFGRIIKSPGVSSALEKMRPGAINNVISPWFEDVKNQTYVERSTANRDIVAQYLKRNINTAIYLGAHMTPVRQYFGLTVALAKIPPQYMIASSVLSSVTYFTTKDFINSNSAFMEQRYKTSQKDMIRNWESLESNYDWVTMTGEGIQWATYVFTQAAQNHVDTIVWSAAYKQAQAKGLTHKQSVSYADTRVETTQSSGNVTSKANIQRGKAHETLMGMAANVQIAMQNVIDTEVMRTPHLQKKAAMVISLGMMIAVLPSILDNVISEKLDFKDDDDEEEKKSPEELEQESLQLMSARIAGNLVDTIWPAGWGRAVSGGIQGFSASLGPAYSSLNTIPAGVSGAKNYIKGVDLTAFEVASLLKGITIVTGIPVSVIGKGILINEATKDPDQQAEERAIRKSQIEEVNFKNLYEE